jgi:hypothetical protein
MATMAVFAKPIISNPMKLTTNATSANNKLTLGSNFIHLSGNSQRIKNGLIAEVNKTPLEKASIWGNIPKINVGLV